MQYREYLPHPSLSHAVRCYWIFEHSSAGPWLERMVPDGHIDWVLHYGARPTLVIDGQQVAKRSAFMGGHLLRGVQLRVLGSLRSFGIKFHPWAAPLLYPMPARELNHRREPVADILSVRTPGLEDWLLNELSEGRIDTVIERVQPLIRSWLAPQTSCDRLLQSVCQQAMRAAGQLRVADIERRSGYSRRYLERVFAQRRGMSMKYFVRLLRLRSIARRLAQSRPCRLADVALAFGYCDQAHFCRDFAAIVGTSPTRYQAEQNVYVTHESGGATADRAFF